MLSYAHEVASRAEALAQAGRPVGDVLDVLRTLPLDDFAEFLLLNPQPRYPALGSMLPPMATAAVQQQWTGADGYVLLRQTLAFVRIVTQTYAELYGRNMQGRRILDFGCGYGRIMRPLYYYANPDRICGCDPWSESLAVCHRDRLLGDIRQSDYLPRSLPFEGTFDVAYAFSVFTHLSLTAARACLDALASAMAENGLLVITLRPSEYWDFDQRAGIAACERLKADHLEAGFAYVPHGNIMAGGEAVYGDTSMSLEFLEGLVPAFKIVRYTRSLDDPYQIIVFLQRR